MLMTASLRRVIVVWTSFSMLIHSIAKVRQNRKEKRVSSTRIYDMNPPVAFSIQDIWITQSAFSSIDLCLMLGHECTHFGSRDPNAEQVGRAELQLGAILV
jgi:hypothetical protein